MPPSGMKIKQATAQAQDLPADKEREAEKKHERRGHRAHFLIAAAAIHRHARKASFGRGDGMHGMILDDGTVGRARYMPKRTSHLGQSRCLTVSRTVNPQVSRSADNRATPVTSQAGIG